jgi:hypothetical protein
MPSSSSLIVLAAIGGETKKDDNSSGWRMVEDQLDDNARRDTTEILPDFPD